MDQVSSLIIRKLENMAMAPDRGSILSRHEAISVLFSYAIRMEQSGQQAMVDALQRLMVTPDFRGCFWIEIQPYILTIFGKVNTPPLHRALPSIFSCITWDKGLRRGDTVTGWAAAALVEPSTEEDAKNVVNLLLQFASWHNLRPYIPADIWEWLKRRPPLPPVCTGRMRGTQTYIVDYIRGLGDIELLKSYFLVVWSEWDEVEFAKDKSNIQGLIRDAFGGIGDRHHREDLTERLDRVLEQLDRGPEYLQQHNPRIDKYCVGRMKEQYGWLRRVLLEVDGNNENPGAYNLFQWVY